MQAGTVDRTAPIIAEFVGTAFLVAAVIGSGIMAERLADGNDAVALLANAVATGAALLALIATFAPLSGAHFNPAVSFLFASNGHLPRHSFGPYVLAQVVGALVGAMLANAMFDLTPLHLSHKLRLGYGQFFAEIVATFGLLIVIWAGYRTHSDKTLFAVPAYIVGAYWFTSSTAFANPAVTFGRIFSDTFAGIRWIDAVGFIVAQSIGTALAMGFSRFLMPASALRSETLKSTREGAKSEAGAVHTSVR
jgi:glycerol uptake facilitator-like aquaporin